MENLVRRFKLNDEQSEVMLTMVHGGKYFAVLEFNGKYKMCGDMKKKSFEKALVELGDDEKLREAIINSAIELAKKH